MTETQMAKAMGRSLNVSPKYAMMVCQYLRGKKTSEAKRFIAAVLEKKESVPFTKFNDGVGHRRGKGASGRFPKKACEAVLMLIKSAEANATDKGMGTELRIAELRANRAATRMTGGKNPGRLTKRAHIHIALTEIIPSETTQKKVTKKKPEAKAETSIEESLEAKTTVKAESKTEVKAEAKKAEVKTEATPEVKADAKVEAKPVEKKVEATPKTTEAEESESKKKVE